MQSHHIFFTFTCVHVVAVFIKYFHNLYLRDVFFNCINIFVTQILLHTNYSFVFYLSSSLTS